MACEYMVNVKHNVDDITVELFALNFVQYCTLQMRYDSTAS